MSGLCPRFLHQKGDEVRLADPADTSDQAQETVEKKVEMGQHRVRDHVGDAFAFVKEGASGQLDHGHSNAQYHHDWQNDLGNLGDKTREKRGKFEKNKDG